jgi:hypothetical protein
MRHTARFVILDHAFGTLASSASLLGSLSHLKLRSGREILRDARLDLGRFGVTTRIRESDDLDGESIPDLGLWRRWSNFVVLTRD